MSGSPIATLLEAKLSAGDVERSIGLNRVALREWRKAGVDASPDQSEGWRRYAPMHIAALAVLLRTRDSLGCPISSQALLFGWLIGSDPRGAEPPMLDAAYYTFTAYGFSPPETLRDLVDVFRSAALLDSVEREELHQAAQMHLRARWPISRALLAYRSDVQLWLVSDLDGMHRLIEADEVQETLMYAEKPCISLPVSNLVGTVLENLIGERLGEDA